MFEEKTYEKILEEMLSMVTADVDKREGSVIFDALAPCAYYLAQQFFLLENYLDLIFSDTAEGDFLDRRVRDFNIIRKPATCAKRKVVADKTIKIGSRFGIENVTYIILEELNPCVYLAQCEQAGEIGNQYAGELLPISNLPGIKAELTEIITPGTELETDEALRKRFFEKVRLPVTSGNKNHYKQWALEVPGVGDARVFPLDNGPGTGFACKRAY